MKEVILNYLHRWRWVWLPLALLQLVTAFLLLTQARFATVIIGSAFLGPYLLSFEVMRQPVRALLALPLSRRQLGWAWWWVAVALPGALVFATSLLVWLLVTLTGMNQVVPGLHFLRLTLLAAAFIGVMFAVLIHMPTPPVDGLGRNILAGVLGGLWGLGIAGMMFLPTWYLRHPQWWPYLDVVTVAGLAVSVGSGWWAETMVVSRLHGTAAKGSSGRPKEAAPVGGGWSGLPLFGVTLLKTSGHFCTMMVVAIMGMGWLFGIPWRADALPARGTTMVKFMGAVQFGYWFVAVILVGSWIGSLRSMRVLPIRPGGLAVLLLSAAGVPMLLLLGFQVGLAAACQDFSQLGQSLRMCMVFCMAGSLAVWLLVRLGLSLSGFMVIIVGGTMSMTTTTLWIDRVEVFWLAGALPMVVGASWWLLRRELCVRSTAYRQRWGTFPTMGG